MTTKTNTKDTHKRYCNGIVSPRVRFDHVKRVYYAQLRCSCGFNTVTDKVAHSHYPPAALQSHRMFAAKMAKAAA